VTVPFVLINNKNTDTSITVAMVDLTRTTPLLKKKRMTAKRRRKMLKEMIRGGRKYDRQRREEQKKLKNTNQSPLQHLHIMMIEHKTFLQH